MKKLLLLVSMLGNPTVERIHPPFPGPSLDDLPRFPCLIVAQKNYELAREHCLWLQGRIMLGEIQYVQWHKEACVLRDIWYALYCAQNSDYVKENRVAWLKDVYNYVSWEDWNMGKMPPCVPFKYFQEVPDGSNR